MKMRITVEGKTYEVEVEVLDTSGGALAPAAPPSAQPGPAPTSAPAPSAAAAQPAPQPPSPAPGGGSDAKQVTAPIGGNVTKVNVAAGDDVTENQVIMVMEAMKMETNIAAPAGGRIKTLHVGPGDSVTQGQLLAEFD